MNNQLTVKLSSPAQIAFVVKDREKARAFYSTHFGIGPWRVAELEYPEIMVRGKKSAYKMALASFAWGNDVDLCLVQPLSGGSLYSEFLEEGREGLHHLAFDFPKEEKERVLAELKPKGIEVIQGAVSSFGTGASFAYLNTDQMGGAIFEVRYRPSKNPPHFYKLVPEDASQQAKVKLRLPSQVGLVVKDLDKTIEFYSSTLGFGPWQIGEVEFLEILVRGQQSRCKLRIATAELGAGMELELISPLSGNSLYSEFLAQGKEGFHHLSFDFTRDGVEQALAALQEEGIEILQSAKNADGSFAYLNTAQIGGAIFKLRHKP